MLSRLLLDDSGATLSAEHVLVVTITVLGLIVGLSEVAVAVNTELNDVSNAIGALDQSYFLPAFCTLSPKNINLTSGSRFTDAHDDCDRNRTCDLVCGPSGACHGPGGIPGNDSCG